MPFVEKFVEELTGFFCYSLTYSDVTTLVLCVKWFLKYLHFCRQISSEILNKIAGEGV